MSTSSEMKKAFRGMSAAAEIRNVPWRTVHRVGTTTI